MARAYQATATGYVAITLTLPGSRNAARSRSGHSSGVTPLNLEPVVVSLLSLEVLNTFFVFMANAYGAIMLVILLITGGAMCLRWLAGWRSKRRDRHRCRPRPLCLSASCPNSRAVFAAIPQAIVLTSTRSIRHDDLTATRDTRIPDHPCPKVYRVRLDLEVLPLSSQAGSHRICGEGSDHYATSCSWPA